MSVIAISKGQIQCGKRVKDSKRRYHWIFKINQNQHKLQLIISFLSGKRKVILDQKDIYEQKNLLNIKFDFRYNIGYNNIQLSQQLNQFTLRINNQTFQQLLDKNNQFGLQIQKKQQKKLQKTHTNDPFSQFDNIFSKNQINPTPNISNPFQQFDLNFKFSQTLQTNIQQSNVTQNNNKQNKSQNIQSFQNSFKQFDNQYNEDNMFATNAYKPSKQIFDSYSQFQPKYEKPSGLSNFLYKVEQMPNAKDIFNSFFVKKQQIKPTNINNNNTIDLL